MSQKPETTFYQSIHKKLHKEIHREKMSNPYARGTPDVWYSGKGGDLWVEYKVGNNPLTYNQLSWLRKRCEEGRNVAVINKRDDHIGIYFKEDISKGALVPTPTLMVTEVANVVQWIEDLTL